MPDWHGRLLLPGECRRLWRPLYPGVLRPWLDRELTTWGVDPAEIQALDPACFPDFVWTEGRPIDLPRLPDRRWVVLHCQLVAYAPLDRSWWVALDPTGLIIAAGERTYPTESLPARTAPPP